jgi:hypothetical protein
MTLAPPGERSAAGTFSSGAKIMFVERSSFALSKGHSGVRTPYGRFSSISLGEKKFFY